MLRLIFIFTVSALTSFAARAASPNDCQFVARDALGATLSEMPANIIGWMNCSKHAPGTNVFLVARMKTLTEFTLTQLVTDHAKKIDITAETTTVTWQSKQPLASRQLMVRTVSPMNSAGERLAMSHYAFVVAKSDGSLLVLIHSMDESETNKIKDRLDNVNRHFATRRSQQRVSREDGA